MKNTSHKLSAVIFLLSFCGFSFCHLPNQSASQIGLIKHFEDTIKNRKAQLDKDIKVEDTIFSFVDEMPEFPGGPGAMMKFLTTSFTLKDTKDCSNSRVVITFVVAKNGKIINPKIIRSACPTIDQQVMKVVKSFPDWKPGKHNGKPVNVCFTFPVVVELKE